MKGVPSVKLTRGRGDDREMSQQADEVHEVLPQEARTTIVPRREGEARHPMSQRVFNCWRCGRAGHSRRSPSSRGCGWPPSVGRSLHSVRAALDGAQCLCEVMVTARQPWAAPEWRAVLRRYPRGYPVRDPCRPQATEGGPRQEGDSGRRPKGSPQKPWVPLP